MIEPTPAQRFAAARAAVAERCRLRDHPAYHVYPGIGRALRPLATGGSPQPWQSRAVGMRRRQPSSGLRAYEPYLEAEDATIRTTLRLDPRGLAPLAATLQRSPWAIYTRARFTLGLDVKLNGTQRPSTVEY